LRMLELFPEAATKFTTDPVRSFSVLDLHEFCKVNWQDSLEEWHHVRELLFSFDPTLESHRHRKELLDRCVRLVISELNGSDNFHLTLTNGQKDNAPDLELTHTLSAMEAPMRATRAAARLTASSAVTKSRSRMQMSRRKPNPSTRTVSPRSLKQPDKKKDMTDASISIYDEDDTTLGNYALEVSRSHDDEQYGDDASYFSDQSTDDTESYTSEKEMTNMVGDIAVGIVKLFPHIIAEDEESYEASYTDGESTFDGTATFDQSTMQSRSTLADTTFDSLSHNNNGMPNTLENIFENAKAKALKEEEEAKARKDQEEKKEEEAAISHPRLKTPRAGNRKMITSTPKKPEFLSEVAFRLWTFFVLYCDPNNPSDNYVAQVADIFDEIQFSTV
jgi:hypothetical protein